MTRRTDRFRACWDRTAPTYDTRMTTLERRLLADSRRWVGARAHGRTLEVAVGTGENLAHYGRDVDLTGVDWSAAMVEVARARGAREGRSVDLRQADATALPYAAASFDTVTCTFALCCIPDPGAALAEMLRVLRPGGGLLLADHVASTSWPVRVLQHVADLVSVPLQGEHYTRRPLTLLRALDVEVVETERRSLGIIERVHARRPRI